MEAKGKSNVINPEKLEKEKEVVEIPQFEKEQTFLETLKKVLQPYLLRRFKRDVLKDLPKKKEVIVRVEMCQKQKDLSKLLLRDQLQVLA